MILAALAITVASILAPLPETPATFGWTIETAEYTGHYAGSANPQTRTITIYTGSPHNPTQTAAHEIGHAAWYARLTSAERNTWAAHRGLTGPWYPPRGHADYNYVSGDWADCYRQWATGAAHRGRGGHCDRGDLELMRRMIDTNPAPPPPAASNAATVVVDDHAAKVLAWWAGLGL